MSRVTEVLERESRTVDLEPGDFERLLGRRDRKHRNRRIRAGALGVLMTLALGTFFARSLLSADIPADQPVPTGMTGTLAYAQAGGIYVAALDGTDPVRISDALDDECSGGYWGPSWSPDGRYLAFQACEDHVITDPQGNVVSTFPTQAQLAWSPDSTRLAVWDEYSWDEDGVGTFTIGIYRIDGTRETQFTLPPGWEPPSGRAPIWTPDGASLLVGHLEIPVGGETPRELPFGTETFRARSGGFWENAFAYSPDGSQVAYGTRDALVVARGDGSEPRAVLGEPAHTAAWSPNGRLLAVTSHPRGGPVGEVGTRLHLVDVATGSATLLFEGEPGTGLNAIGFSPDGDRVLFGEQRALSVADGSYLYSLWSVGIDGSDARTIKSGTNEGAWRPRT